MATHGIDPQARGLANRPNLSAFAGLTGAADKLAYFTGASTMALTNLVSQARSFLATPTSVYVTQTQTGTGATARTVQAKLAEVISVTDFGVATTASAADNLANFKLAVAACPVGGIVDVPPHADPYIIDTTGGLSTCIVVSTRITIRLRGDVKANFSAIQANPPFIFHFTGAGSGLEGPGRVIGDGTVNALSDASATVDQNPGLVRLAADYTFCRNVGFVTAPKTALLLYGCYHCDISGNRFTGGITAYHSTAAASQTAYFGIYTSAGGHHIIRDNFFYPDVSGGMLIQCMFSNGSTHNCEIVNNFAYRPYEKLLYWFGSGNTASGNIIIGNTGTIPGTNMQGTVGGVIRFHGSNNKISGNYTTHCGGGGICYDGEGNEIVGNTFINCGNFGVAVLGTTSRLTQTRVDRNRISYTALVGQAVADGIEVTCSYAATSTQVSVCDNIVSGFSLSDPIVNIPVWQATTAYNKISTVKPTVGNGRIYDPLSTTTGGTTAGVEPTWPTTPGATVVDGTVTWVARSYGGIRDGIRVTGNASGYITFSAMSRNNTYGDVNGINFEYVTDSTAAFNDISASGSCMEEASGARNQWFYNAARGGGTATVVGIAGTSVFVSGSAVTGTGALVQATSPTLVTPAIGAATGTSLTTTGDIASSAGEFRLANGKHIRFQRNSGGIYIQTLGIPTGTDDVRLLSTGDFLFADGGETTRFTVKNDGSLVAGNTGAWTVPSGTTAQRPAGVNGMIRYNTTLAKMEIYEAGAWANVI